MNSRRFAATPAQYGRPRAGSERPPRATAPSAWRRIAALPRIGGERAAGPGERHRPRRRPRGPRPDRSAIGRPARSNSSTSRSTRSAGGPAKRDAEVGQALADQALRRVDQQDRRLEAAGAVDELGLLPGVLEVVARVRLVGDRVGRGPAPGPAGPC